MKVTLANIVRENYVKKLFEAFRAEGEDVGMITSNSFNFPITQDGEEGVVEIVVKVPTYDGDEIYALREDYELKCEERAVKAEAAARKKLAKIEKDKVAREEKKAAREKAKADRAVQEN